MSNIDEATVNHIAKLARIKIDGEEAKFANDLSGIFSWIEQLREVNTENVEAISGVTSESLPLREDEITDGNQQEAVLKNAPDSGYGCFFVPKVVE